MYEQQVVCHKFYECPVIKHVCDIWCVNCCDFIFVSFGVAALLHGTPYYKYSIATLHKKIDFTSFLQFRAHKHSTVAKILHCNETSLSHRGLFRTAVCDVSTLGSYVL